MKFLNWVKLQYAQRKYAPYDLKVNAIDMPIKHIHEDLENRDFEVY